MLVATFSLRDIARHGAGAARSYVVRLLKDADFIPGGEARFSSPVTYSTPTRRDVWREGSVTGHVTGLGGAQARGAWDLIGGSLKVLLGSRLDGYRSST